MDGYTKSIEQSKQLRAIDSQCHSHTEPLTAWEDPGHLQADCLYKAPSVSRNLASKSFLRALGNLTLTLVMRRTWTATLPLFFILVMQRTWAAAFPVFFILLMQRTWAAILL